MKTAPTGSDAEAAVAREAPEAPVAAHRWLLLGCVLATGFAGIVAEYVMATLASYLLGSTVVQYVLVIALMLFCMGLGSRLSKRVPAGWALPVFVGAELGLSLTCGLSALAVYALSTQTEQIGLVIYATAAGIGIGVGLEIPLVARLNARHEALADNVGSVLEFDYVGALLGGLFFAFVGLPVLGLTYTPPLLGAVNLGVAAVLAWAFRRRLPRPRLFGAAFAGVAAALVLGAAFARPVVLYGEQRGYQDTIIHREQSRHQRIVMTEWRGHHWLYLDRNVQFSSYDEERYHEPLVHPAMLAAQARRRVLILGGGDGLAAREVLKYDAVEQVTLVDLDPAVTRLGREHPVLTRLNEGSLNAARVDVVNRGANAFLKENDTLYDVVIVDLPDPKTVDLARLYTRAFYRHARRHLSAGGVLVTQATSPVFSERAFFSILKTMRAAGFAATGYHTHVPTMGEWGWVLGRPLRAPGDARPPSPLANAAASSDAAHVDSASRALRTRLPRLPFERVRTRFLTGDVMDAMLTFGPQADRAREAARVNTTLDLALYHHYHDGAWDLY